MRGAVDDERFLERAHDPVRDDLRLRRGKDIRGDQREFVSAETRQRVYAAGRLAQAARRFDKNLVAARGPWCH